MPQSFELPSFAKINWLLEILGRRVDGFHELFTLFQTISLHDTLRFSPSDELRLTCDEPSIPTDGRNLIMKAAELLSKRIGKSKGASIHLSKRIPSPGGLGGGSSNAAVTLIGLKRLWKADISDEVLESIAAELGSDVPFFLHGGTAIGTGRGEVISQFDDITAKEMLVVVPSVAVLTADAFSRLRAPTLTSEALKSNLSVCRKRLQGFDPQHSVLKNDFEASIFAAYPEIEAVKERLTDLGAANVALSGSGASIFALFDKQEARQTAFAALDKYRDWRKFAVSTVSQSSYCEALF